MIGIAAIHCSAPTSLINVGPVTSNCKVLIVGGSVAGMSCAIQMRKAGFAVDLVEMDRDWKSYGAGLTITGPTLRALDTLGVLQPVLAAGATWNGLKVHDKAGALLEQITFPTLSDTLPATGGIMRPLLHKILSARTLELGAQVRLGISLKGLSESAEGVRVEFSDGTSRIYDLLVGADGIYSSVRKLLFPTAPRATFTGQVIFRLVAERPAGFECTHFYMGEDVKLGFNPVSATHMYMFLLFKPPGDLRIDPSDQPQRLFEMMQGFGGFVPEVRATVKGRNAHSINYRPLEVILLDAPWHGERTVLIGDACHATTPHLASGAGMAIEDGIVLAEEVSKRSDLGAAFQNFMDRRFERCRLVVDNSVKLGQIEMNHGSMVEHTRLMGEAMKTLRQPI
jgi:2-polyprenyl-6-methoxyphenol hydroxylase-like FAD-dependent oxidoreductase